MVLSYGIPSGGASANQIQATLNAPIMGSLLPGALPPTQQFTASPNAGLIPGIETQTPLFDVPSDQSHFDRMGFFQFNTNHVPVSGFWSVRYTIDPPSPTARAVVIDFELEGNTHLNIRYRLVNANTGVPLVVAPINFQMHNSTTWLPIQTYLTANHAPGYIHRDPDNLANLIEGGSLIQVVQNYNEFPAIYYIDGTTELYPAIPANLDYPQFRIGQQMGTEPHPSGFTFIFGSNPVSIRWDSDIVTIASQDFVPGRIHEVRLYQGPNEADVTFSNQIFLVTGISGIMGTPFANGNRTASYADRIDRRYEDDESGELVASAHPHWPADPVEPIGTTLSFDLPLLNGSIPSFQIDATVVLHSSVLGEPPVSIHVADIYSFSPTTANPNITLSRDSVGNREILNVRIDDMEPGTIFTGNSNIVLQSANPDLYTRTAGIPFPEIFTFPSFEIRIINNLPFIAISPFGMPGQYMLKFDGYVSDGVLGTVTDPRDHLSELGSLVHADGTEDVILMPVPNQIMHEPEGLFLQVFFVPNGSFGAPTPGGTPDLASTPQFVYSQKLLYFMPPVIIGVHPPSLLNIISYLHSPVTLERDRGLLEMSMTLDVGTHFIMDTLFYRDSEFNYAEGRYELVIYYELRAALSPYPGSPEEHFATVRAVFSSDTKNYMQNFELELFYAHPTVELLGEGDLNALGQVTLVGNIHHTISMNFEIDTLHRLEDTAPNYVFTFPNIYFLNVSPVYEGVSISPSIYVSITIDDFGVSMVPPPQVLRITEGSEIAIDTLGYEQSSFDLEFALPAMQIREYVINSYGLHPEDASFYINIYISENESFMRDTLLSSDTEASLTDYADVFNRHTHSITQIHDALLYPLAQPTLDDYVESFFFSSMRGNDAMEGAPLNVLRNNGTVAIRRIPLNETQLSEIMGGGSSPTILFRYRLDGLDFNTQYFITADIEVHQFEREVITIDGVDDYGDPYYDEEIELHFAIKAISGFAPLIGITTPAPIDIPTGIEQDPPAPTPLNVRDVTLDSATIYFNRVLMDEAGLPEGYTVTTDYEFIRIRGNQIDPSLMNNRNSLQTFWPGLVSEHGPVPTGLTAFRTHNSQLAGGSMQVFNGTSWGAAPAGIVGEFSAGVITVTDNTLESNTIYFYYVRTVREITDSSGGTTRRYSVFNHTTLTTTLVEAPENLIVETGEVLSTGAPNREFDGMREIVISFEALISNMANLSLNNMFFEYRIQIDEEGWGNPIAMSIPFLLANNEARQDNIRWFLYYITSGIEPGRMHHIQVRTVQIDSSGRRSVSPWTPHESWLAQPDSAADEEERIEEDWRNRLRDELYRLLRRPYWVMRNDVLVFSVYLRPAHFDEMILSGTGRRVYLPFEPRNQTVYYIPASIFARLVEEEASFVLVSDYVELTMPNRVIDLNNNPAVLTVADAIRRGEVYDYLVRLNVNWGAGPTIGSNPSIIPTANISLNLVASAAPLNIWENALVYDLLSLIEDLLRMETIVAALERGEQNILIARRLLDIVDHAEREFIRISANHFRTIPTRNPLLVHFDSQMLLAPRNTQPEDVVHAYELRAGSWTRVPGSFSMNRGIAVPSAGTFVFTGRTIVIDGLQNVAGSGNTRAIVARHGLDDFLGGDIGLDEIVTRQMLANSVARMLGANEGQSAIVFLRSNGITVPPGNQTQPVPTQEAVALIMAVYASRTATSVSSIRISNFGLTAGLPGLSPQFTESFRAAIEVGIYRDYNLTPNTALTVGELLEILTALDNLVDL